MRAIFAGLFMTVRVYNSHQPVWENGIILLKRVFLSRRVLTMAYSLLSKLRYLLN